MIVFIESGRLGNQLFQYAALRSIAGSTEALVLAGFDDLRSVFDGLDARFPLPTRTTAFRLARRLGPALERALVDTRILGAIREHPSTALPVCSPGICSRVWFAPAAYFQSEQAFDPAVIAGLSLRPPLAQAAAREVDPIRSQGRRPVFVHVRRGDYLRFPSPEFPAVLPDDWYRERMLDAKAAMPDASFLLFSDDVAHAREAFGSLPHTSIRDVDAATAFATMCACDGGILSASSFAWWSAYLARRGGATGPFLAPRYWIGHPRQQWYPAAIESGFLSYA